MQKVRPWYRLRPWSLFLQLNRNIERSIMKQTKNQELFRSDKISKAMLALSVPTIISQLINLIYNMVDTFFVGMTGDSYKIAGVTIAFALFMLTIALSNLFGIGGGSLIARLLGQNDTKNARRVSAFSFYASILAALLYSLILWLLEDPILRMLGASENTILFSRQYTTLVVILGSVPLILSAVVAHMLRNVGYSKEASIGLSSGGILNIVLDPIFMFIIMPKGNEVLGAALATLIANIIAMLYLLWKMKQVSKVVPLSMSPSLALQIQSSDRRSLFAVGIPSALLTGLFDLANIILNKLMAGHGDLNLAAIGIVMKAERLPNAINTGICQGMLPLVAYNFSSGDHKRMHEAIRLGRLWGLSVALISLVLFLVFAGPVVHIFLNTDGEFAESAIATLSLASLYLRLRVLGSPIQFINYHTSFILQAVGAGKETLLHSIVRELVFYIPLMFVLNWLFGATGIASALVVGELGGAMFALYLLRRWLRENANIAL